MDEVKKITEDRITEIMGMHGFNKRLLTKDYYITIILFLLKDTKGIYFKGGTALQKIFLDYSRLSEDADFTVTEDVDRIKDRIKTILVESDFFNKVTKDKHVHEFIRLIAHYKDFESKDDAVFIDLNRRAKLLRKPQTHTIKHFYEEEIPRFSVTTLSKDEMIAEKMVAAISRNKPRDHFDLYQIINKGFKIDRNLVEKKCKLSGVNPSIIRMFNRARKLYNRWKDDTLPLISDKVSFSEVMKTLSDYFNLKEEKERLK